MTYDTINDAQTIAGSGEGTLLANRYRVVRQLGQGGMGSVWLAEDTQLDNKPFAIKMLPSILVSNKRAYRQLKDEALVAMKLTHPNIVTLRAFEENNGNPFLVMDYIDGQTLDDYLADYGSRVEHVERVEMSEAGRDARPARPLGGLPEADVLRILRPIAAALDYAHSKGVVHRDVKPGNVMIAKDGTPYILDFGIAREIQETITRVTGKLSSGTLLYMSPEQLRGHAPKPAQDVYSFAAMAYECLKGEPLFVRGQIEFQILNEQPEPLLGGTQLVASVMSGLAKKPEDRLPTCTAVLEGNGPSRVEHVERVESVGARVPVLRSFSEGGAHARSDEPQPSAIGWTGSPSMPSPQEQGAFSHKEHKEHKEVGHGISRSQQGGAWKVLLAMVALGLVIAGGWAILALTKPITLSNGKAQLWEGGPYWADRNIGAKKPWNPGYYFWWGDTIGYKWENNAWVASDGSSENFEFSSENTPTSDKTPSDLQSEGWITADGVLALEHDAAQVQWGGEWRMPTRYELDDLCNKCEWIWTKMNGINGYVVRGRGSYASNSIFLPCVGYGSGVSLNDAGSDGYYWSSKHSYYNDDIASWYLSFISSHHGPWCISRGCGQPVRPVQGFTK